MTDNELLLELTKLAIQNKALYIENTKNNGQDGNFSSPVTLHEGVKVVEDIANIFNTLKEKIITNK
ncbi:hypothetical protein CPIN18021_0329 [Campylobacter pinnipediorum subsp. caledonicus]|uniref:Uncharacterized protein n=1 Tax=Campylobacter pinnipediorum subsp. caledonicus TaxID=1874362 RepID=A0A1S6U602_9BACT|nr:hypothetical protein CPIN18021_0329 [Campylobacter pinnipediorum subsp. caledonicus]